LRSDENSLSSLRAQAQFEPARHFRENAQSEKAASPPESALQIEPDDAALYAELALVSAVVRFRQCINTNYLCGMAE